TAPSRVFRASIPPSAFSIWPRMRVGCCAKAVVAKSRAMAAEAANIHCVIFDLYIMNILPMWSGERRAPIRRMTPIRPGYSSLFLEQIGFNHSPQFRSDFRTYTEPKLKPTYCLMQQHSKPIRRSQAPRTCRSKQSSHQRVINEIGNHERWRAPQIEFKRRLPNHSERGGVDQKPGASQQSGGLLPTSDLHTGTEFFLQRFRACRGSIDDVDATDFARKQCEYHGACAAAGPEHYGRREPTIPSRRNSIEIGKKPFDIRIGRTQPVIVVPKRVGSADCAGAVIRLRQLKRSFLVRHREVGTDIANRAQFADKISEFFRRHGLTLIFGIEVVLLDPVIVN